MCGWGVSEGTVPLAQRSAGFQSLSPLPTSKLGTSGADSWVGSFVYILGPCRSLQWTLLWGWEFFLLSQSPHVFSVRGYEALFHHTGTLCCGSLSHSPVVPSSLSTCKCGTTQSASHCLARSPLCPCCPSLSLLPVWVNVSFLTSWLSDFHTVWFSGSSGYFLFLNLLLSFFLFCKETKFMYLCLHLGQMAHFKITGS